MIRHAVLLVMLQFAAGASAEAQTARSILLQQASAAYEGFESSRALDLTRAALDPALGQPDSAWTQSVHLLLQVLLENGDEPLARTWARWAMQFDDGMTVDSLKFLATVATVLQEARTDVRARRGADDQFSESWVWVWPARGSSATEGQLRLDPAPSAQPLNVNVMNSGGARVGALVSGQSITLTPGTYEIQVSAPGYSLAQVTREVLPGVTLAFSPRLVAMSVANATLTDSSRRSLFDRTLLLAVTRSRGLPSTCASGVVTGSRLAVTSYSAIRGASALALTMRGSPVAGTIRVAAYDAPSDIAILQIPAPVADSIPFAPDVTEGQSAWGVGVAECRSLSDARTNIRGWRDRPVGTIELGGPLPRGALGAPVVDSLGRLTGLWSGELAAIPAQNALALLALARRNVIGERTMTLDDVARRESHVYGNVVVSVDAPEATVRLTPLERWHWRELATVGAAPFEFSGPMGRYRLDVSAPGLASRSQEISLFGGDVTRVAIPLRIATTPGPVPNQQPIVKRAGVPKWVWFAVLGGGAAAALTLGGSKPTTGTLTLTIPDP